MNCVEKKEFGRWQTRMDVVGPYLGLIIAFLFLAIMYLSVG